MHVKTIPNTVITPPDEIVSKVEVAKCIDVGVDCPSIVLPPDSPQCVEAVRNKLIKSGISEKDIAGASAWARRPKE